MKKKDLLKQYKQALKLLDENQGLKSIEILASLSFAWMYFKEVPIREEFIDAYSRRIIRKIKDHESKIQALNYRAIILMNLENISGAEKIIQGILKIHDDDVLAISTQSGIYERRGKLYKAINFVSEKISQGVNNPLLLNNLGNLYEYINKYKTAIKYYEESLAINYLQPITFFYTGRANYHLEQYETAISFFQKAVSLKEFLRPNEKWQLIDFYTYLGDTFFELRNYKNAQKIFESIITLHPDRPEGYYFLAEFYYMIGKENKSIHYINKSIDLAPPNIFFLERKATFLHFQHKTNDAINTLLKAYKLEPRNIRILDFLGKLYYAMGQNIKALKVYKKRLKIKENKYIKLIIAEIYFKLENYIQSLAWINDYIRMETANPKAYLLRAKLNAISGYKVLAVDDLFKMLELEKDEKINIFDSDWFYLENLYETEGFKLFLERIGKQ